MEGSLSRFGLGSFENLLNQFQVISRKGMARSNIPNKQDVTFTQHFQYFSQVINKLPYFTIPSNETNTGYV